MTNPSATAPYLPGFLPAPPPGLPAEPLGHHRLARISARHRWWRPALGTLFVAVAYTVTVGLLYALVSAVGVARGYREGPDGTVEFGPVTTTAVDLAMLAVAIPLVLLAVRRIGRRPAGTVSSVTGGLRWRWLARCLLVALPILALTTGAMLLLPAQDGPERQWAGWAVFGPALAMLVVLVPLQAAAEEYAFRGWLIQAVGAFLCSPWPAIVPQAVLFAAAHGRGTPWGFADLVVFGAVAGWLTVRTGGLEAAIGLHAVNNLFAFAAAAFVVDGLESDDTAADAPWELVALDLTGVALYTAAVLWPARPHRPGSALVRPGTGPAHPGRIRPRTRTRLPRPPRRPPGRTRSAPGDIPLCLPVR
ncbi:CPBP family intramembrane metalloprotease [Streptomyces phaeoluteigriseus]|uniref:CPBP family intramembrane metalloprotease n=1 Tax=Streptomyces phaeoluteigriseus TaxID=114686 RepID=A0ABY4Z7L2_9ACTN|nr:CPBP family intramembrane glutamic endopeptidase [Streptomyces phaeoluteigriseus]USQ84971.1 CPBP family intramembrane metalloprotease [Streptomyces phaeoluteigriseus]